MFIAVEVLRSFTCLVGAGEMVEIESPGFEVVAADFVFSCGIHAYQDPPVLSQDVVDIPDITGVVAVQTVVESNAARV